MEFLDRLVKKKKKRATRKLKNYVTLLSAELIADSVLTVVFHRPPRRLQFNDHKAEYEAFFLLRALSPRGSMQNSESREPRALYLTFSRHFKCLLEII